MAAGCTLAARRASTPSTRALQQVAGEWLDAARAGARRCAPTARSRAEYFDAETVRTLDAQVWGQAFEAPLFCDEVEVVCAAPGRREAPEARAARRPAPLRDGDLVRPQRAGAGDACGWRTGSALDEYQGSERVQMVVEAAAG